MVKAPLTAVENETLAYIIQHRLKAGRAPSRGEIAKRFGVCVSVAHRRVLRLMRKGAVRLVWRRRGVGGHRKNYNIEVNHF